MRHLVNTTDFSVSELDQLLCLAEQMRSSPEQYRQACAGRILATLFFEPSTRTRLSFESAMLSLGGNVIGFSEPTTTSAAKGECLADTIEMVNGYADIIALRHPGEGAAAVAAAHADVPLINAGDGGHSHPGGKHEQPALQVVSGKAAGDPAHEDEERGEKRLQKANQRRKDHVSADDALLIEIEMQVIDDHEQDGQPTQSVDDVNASGRLFRGRSRRFRVHQTLNRKSTTSPSFMT